MVGGRGDPGPSSFLGSEVLLVGMSQTLNGK